MSLVTHILLCMLFFASSCYREQLLSVPQETCWKKIAKTPDDIVQLPLTITKAPAARVIAAANGLRPKFQWHIQAHLKRASLSFLPSHEPKSCFNYEDKIPLAHVAEQITNEQLVTLQADFPMMDDLEFSASHLQWYKLTRAGRNSALVWLGQERETVFDPFIEAIRDEQPVLIKIDADDGFYLLLYSPKYGISPYYNSDYSRKSVQIIDNGEQE